MPPVTIGVPPLAVGYQPPADVAPVQFAVRVIEPGPHLDTGGIVGGGGFAPNAPPTKSSREAVIDCDDLVSSKKLLKQRLGVPPVTHDKSTCPSYNSFASQQGRTKYQPIGM